jgi:N-acetylmuramoyl-L-alanine amidase
MTSVTMPSGLGYADWRPFALTPALAPKLVPKLPPRLSSALLLALAALLAGCASTGTVTDTKPRLDRSLTAVGQDSRVKFIVIHYTVSDLPTSIKILTQQQVSSHYLLTDTPTPFSYALVDESRRAYHAGVSNWKGYSHLNSSSIGIEIVNPGYVDRPEGRLWYPFPQAQIDQLIVLLKDIVTRHGIKPDDILAHSDIAPQRKSDPGPLFPWQQLAAAGLITWPDAARVAATRAVFEQRLPDLAWFQQRLASHGYTVPSTGEFDADTHNVIIAFQMKYRQAIFDGKPDAETAALLYVLTSPQSAGPAPMPPPVPISVSLPVSTPMLMPEALPGPTPRPTPMPAPMMPVPSTMPAQ